MVSKKEKKELKVEFVPPDISEERADAIFSRVLDILLNHRSASTKNETRDNSLE